MAVTTDREPISTKEKKIWYIHSVRLAKNSQDYECRFIFDTVNHRIYDVVRINSYRMNTHSLIFETFNLGNRAQDFVRFSFLPYNKDGNYGVDFLGINGLILSELYGTRYGLDEDIINRLSAQDLNMIDNYCRSIEKEMREVLNDMENAKDIVTSTIQECKESIWSILEEYPFNHDAVFKVKEAINEALDYSEEL